jgi:hypothetical protein
LVRRPTKNRPEHVQFAGVEAVAHDESSQSCLNGGYSSQSGGGGF